MNPCRSRYRGLLVFCLIPLCLSGLSAEERKQLTPPTMAFIDDFQLPPGPAREIIEYRLKPEPAAPTRPPAPIPTPSAAPQVSRPKTSPAPEPEPDPVIIADFSGEPDLLAPEDELFSLFLNGTGWLYTRAVSSSGDEGGIDYRGRNRESGGVRFSFASRAEGLFRLLFIQSGSGGDVGGTTSFLVEVMAEDEFLARVSGTDIADVEDEAAAIESPPSAIDLHAVEELLLSGRYEEAEDALARDYTASEADPVQLWALRFAASLLSGNGTRPQAADPTLTIALIDRLMSLAALIGGVEELDILHAARRFFENHPYSDRLLYRLASRYEGAGPQRDIEAAVRFYNLILNEYPLSPFWDAAEARKNYLERHFLLIR